MPTPKRGEKKPQFISRCIPYVIKEGTTSNPQQAAAICHSIWKENLVESSKIGFDFDDCLNTEKGQILFSRLKGQYEIYIVTRRQESTMSKEVFALAKDLGINRDHIYFTNGKMKWQQVKRLNLGRFYDNSQREIDIINENTECRGILFK